MNWFLPLLLMAAGGASDLVTSIMPQLYPSPEPPKIAAFVGNGGMTAGVRPDGVIAELRWPSPGYFDQVYWGRHQAQSEAGPVMGLVWGFRYPGDDIVWFDTAAWSTRSSTFEEGVLTQRFSNAQGLEVVQRCFADVNHAVLYAEISFPNSSESPPEIFWYAGLNPTARLVPQLPFAKRLFQDAGNVAVQADQATGTVYHLANAEPDTDEQLAADRVPVEGEAASTRLLPQNTIIAYRAPTGILSFTAHAAPPLAGARLAEPRLSGLTAADGVHASVVRIEAEREGTAWRASIAIAAAETREEVEAQLASAADGLDAERQAAISVWNAKQSLVPAWLRPDAPAQRAIELLRSCTAGVGQSIVRAPLSNPPVGVDEPRVGVWLSHALDHLGWHDQAEAHLRFYANAVRAESRENRPYGSMPAALYTNGAEASPPYILATDAPAWFLSACWRHSLFLANAERRSFLASLAGPMGRAMDFLTRWTLNPQKVPVASFDPQVLRETRDVQWLLLAYMGLDAGLQACRAANLPIVDGWASRHRELQAALRFHVLNAEGIVEASPLLPYWLKGILPPEDRAWELRLATPEGPVSFREAPFPASTWPEETAPWPDALQAACYIIGLAQSVAADAEAEL